MKGLTTMTERKNLGKGLDALFGDTRVLNDVIGSKRDNKDVDASSFMVDIESVYPNANQPRKQFDEMAIDELVASVADKGIIQPLIVRKKPQQEKLYEIVAGERRYRAAIRCKLQQIPVIIKDLSDKDVLELALIENIHRQDLTPLEEAEGYHRLMQEFSYTQEQLSVLLGKSRSTIANQLRLLSLPEEVKSMLCDGHISVGHARCLVGSDHAIDIANIIVKSDLSVRQTEALVKSYKDGTVGKKQRVAAPKEQEIIQLETALQDKLGIQVAIKNKQGKGSITLHYKDLEQLDILMGVLIP